MNDQTLGVVGLGYVGVPLLKQAAGKGMRVIGVDADMRKLEMLSDGATDEPELHIPPELMDKVSFSNDFIALQEADVIAICVPTPVNKHFHPDLEILRTVGKSLGKVLQPGQLVILESTVNPNVTDRVLIPLLEEASGKKAGTDFFVAHCPERINPGDETWHVGNIPRVVGGVNQTSTDRAVRFYSSILDAHVEPMATLREAEAVKIVENSFRDVNIAFVNELARSFTHLSIDVVNVIKGAATKPFGFMPHYPGMGVGGHCIPVDPYYLIEEAKANGFYHDFLSLARRINNDMPKFMFEQLELALNKRQLAVNGTDIAVLGVAYKPDVGDVRHSPAKELIAILKKAGAIVRVYDPHVPEGSSVKSLKSALKNAKALVLATGHREFKSIRLSTYKQSGLEVVVDGRNFFDKHKVSDLGLTYVGIGR